MATGLPGLRVDHEPLYSNALVAANLARDTHTDTPAVVLTAPAATAACLERACAALRALRALEPPPPSLPAISAWQQDTPGDAILVLGDLRGEPLHNRLLRLEPLPEAALVAVASQHVGLLVALHAAGFSGLRPSAGETWAWWDGETPWVRFLGWEWLVKSADDAAGDVRAAAGLWIELATGLPPSPDLAVERGPAAWLALSLGTRMLLHETWRVVVPPPAERLARDLAELRRRRDLPPEEQLARGRELLVSNPATGLAWFDLVRRASPPPAGADTAYQAGAAALAGHMAVLIEQGRRDLALGQYEAAERSFSRAGGAWQASKESLLAAARWRTVAAALRQAIQADLTAKGLPVRELERRLIQAVELANDRGAAPARPAVEEILARLPAGIVLPALTGLQAEVRAWQLWEQARSAEAAGQLAPAADLYASVLAEEPQTTYWAELVAALGDPTAAWRAALAAQTRAAEAVALATEAQQRLATGEADTAAALAGRAAALSREQPAQMAEYAALARRATLRGEAVVAGVAASFASLSEIERFRAVNALLILQRAFPDDAWAQEQGTRWRMELLAELSREPSGPVGRWLYEGWPADEAVLNGLKTAASKATADWERALYGAAAQLADGRPAALAEAITWLAAGRQELAGAQRWLDAAGQGDAGQRLLEQAGTLVAQVTRRQVMQSSLRTEFEAALERGQPVAGLLAQAAEVQVELYDDPARSVAQLRLLANRQTAAAPTSPWNATLRLAELAWQAGDPETAQQGFQAVVDDPEAPAAAQQHARLATALLERGSVPAESIGLLDAQWQARADSLLERLNEIATRPAGAPVSASELRRPQLRWLVVLAILLSLLILAFTIASFVNSSGTAAALAEWRTAQASGPVGRVTPPSRTATIGLTASATEKVAPTASAQPTSPATPTKAPTLTPISQVQSLANTTWAGTGLNGMPLVFEFYPGGALLLRYITQAGSSALGTWKLDGDAIYMEVNKQYAEFKGTVDRDRISGEGWNVNGQRWSWSAERQGGASAQPRLSIGIEPMSFDMGIEGSLSFMVRLASLVERMPISVTFAVEPPGLGKVEPAGAAANDRGEIKDLKLTTAQSVGEGVLRAILTNGQVFSATVIVRPVAQVAAASGATLREEPGGKEGATRARDGERYVIVGKNIAGDWWQVRLPTGELAWIGNPVVNVRGKTDQVKVVGTPTPLPPTATPTVAVTPTVPVTPTMAPTGSYPLEGSHLVATLSKQGDVNLYWLGAADEEGLLAFMPGGGTVEVRPSTSVSNTPPLPSGYVLVEAQLWVEAKYVGSDSGGAYLHNNSGAVQQACWQSPDQAGAGRTSCGSLNPANKRYRGLTQESVGSGDWRQVSLWAWMKLENIGTLEAGPSALPMTQAPSLEGTRWVGSDTFNNSLSFEFLSGGVLRYSAQQGDFANGTWRQDGSQIYMETNNKFAEFQGTISGDAMSGSAKNTRGQTWQWRVSRTMKP